MQTSQSTCIINVRRITFGEIYELPRNKPNYEQRWAVNMYVAFHDDSMAAEITLIAPSHDDLVASLPTSHHLTAPLKTAG